MKDVASGSHVNGCCLYKTRAISWVRYKSASLRVKFTYVDPVTSGLSFFILVKVQNLVDSWVIT
jgi:hypothetical protein